MLESFIPFIPALVPCWFHSSLPTVCRNVPAASTMGERRTCWKAQLSGIPCKLVSENCFPETQRRSVKNLRPQGPQTTQKTRPGCTQKTRALPDTLRLTQPCRTTTGAHEHLLTDFRLCPTNRCRCDPWNDQVFFLWLTSSFAIFHKETRKWPCVLINSFQSKSPISMWPHPRAADQT